MEHIYKERNREGGTIEVDFAYCYCPPLPSRLIVLIDLVGRLPDSSESNEKDRDLPDWNSIRNHIISQIQIRRRLPKETRVEAKWCCRCVRTMEFSPSGECSERYCQHKRCSRCVEFNLVDKAEAGGKTREGC